MKIKSVRVMKYDKGWHHVLNWRTLYVWRCKDDFNELKRTLMAAKEFIHLEGKRTRNKLIFGHPDTGNMGEEQIDTGTIYWWHEKNTKNPWCVIVSDEEERDIYS